MSTNPTQPNPDTNNHLYQQVGSWLLLTTTFLLPILVVPLTNNFINQTKLFLLLFTSLLTLLVFLLRSLKKRVWTITASPITLPLLFFSLSTLASTLFTQNYPVKSLLGLGGAYLSATLIALVGPTLISNKQKDKFLPALSISAAVLSLASLLQLAGWGPANLLMAVTGLTVPTNLSFSLAGSSLVAVQASALALIGIVAKYLKSKTINTIDKISLPIIIIGLGLYIYSMLPGKPAAFTFAPVSASWSVALGSLQLPRSALIGQGPEAYSTTFARYKPNWLNGRDYWQFNFGSAAGYPLTIIVQLGLVGLAAWVLLAGKFTTALSKKQYLKRSPLTWMLAASFLIQFFLPPTYVLIGLQGLIMAFWVKEHSQKFAQLNLKALSVSLDYEQDRVRAREDSNQQADWLFSLGTNGVLLIATATLLFLTGKAYASFYHLHQANLALANSNAVGVYEHQRQAVILNPYLDATRRSYAATNLQIASALSNKTDISEQEKKQVSQLVQQATREARAATTIDPTDSRNWQVLAQIYQELIGSIDEAPQWAVDAYVSAIQTDPTNPLLRLSLGHVLMGQEEFNQAANLYTQAADLKPDLAAPYYYLGLVQKQAQNLKGTQRSWQQALSLMDESSEDYGALQKALAELETQLEAQGSGQVVDTQPNQGEGTPLSNELPSLTDQNLTEQTTQPDNQPLELSPDSVEAINQAAETKEVVDPAQTEELETEPTP